VNIGILGTGNLAVTLGAAWAAAGHSLLVTGRSPENARRAARQIGPAAEALGPREMPGRADAVVIAVSWDGLNPRWPSSVPSAGRFTARPSSTAPTRSTTRPGN